MARGRGSTSVFSRSARLLFARGLLLCVLKGSARLLLCALPRATVRDGDCVALCVARRHPHCTQLLPPPQHRRRVLLLDQGGEHEPGRRRGELGPRAPRTDPPHRHEAAAQMPVRLHRPRRESPRVATPSESGWLTRVRSLAPAAHVCLLYFLTSKYTYNFASWPGIKCPNRTFCAGQTTPPLQQRFWLHRTGLSLDAVSGGARARRVAILEVATPWPCRVDFASATVPLSPNRRRDGKRTSHTHVGARTHRI